jgi:hypothetical protein
LHRSTVGDRDGSSDDALDDDDGDNDDAPDASLPPVPSILTADGGQTHLSTDRKVDRRTTFASDSHSLRAPPQ